MLWRALARIFNFIPVRWQRRILDRAHPRFLVGVSGLGVTADGHVILARHRFGSPQWRLLGGFIERRESFPEALRREVHEETGLDIEVGPILEANTGHKWARIEVVYAYRVIGGMRSLSGELHELRAFARDVLPDVRADQRGVLDRHIAIAHDWVRGRTDPATMPL